MNSASNGCMQCATISQAVQHFFHEQLRMSPDRRWVVWMYPAGKHTQEFDVGYEVTLRHHVVIGYYFLRLTNRSRIFSSLG
jgi:hypothetical protein